MTKIFRTAFTVLLLFSSIASAEIGISDWNSAGISLFMEKTEVVTLLGSPDGNEGTMEWYDISNNEGLERVSLEYLDTDMVQAMALSFRPGSIDLDTLGSIVQGAFPGIPEVHRDELMVIFLGRSTDTDEPVYFLAMADAPDKDKGPELITMSEKANRFFLDRKE